MSQLSSTLAEASERNTELLGILSQTDYAAPALKQNVAYISDLQKQIAALERELKKLHTVTEDERKDHLKYRDSTVKRFTAKLGGHKSKEKFASRQEKEEREFLEAWQKEREATERRDELNRALGVAQNDKTSFESDSARHGQAQKDLDQMYNSIFSGPTPELPGEDQMEESVNTTRDWYQQCQTTHGAQKHAFDALQAADKSLQAALRDMKDALDASTWDLWGGGTFADMMERDALSRAQVNISQALYRVEEARRIQPAIKPLSAVNIDLGHFISDVMFDNIFTDMAQHDRIKNSDAQLRNTYKELKQQIKDQEWKVKDAAAQVKQAEQNLEEARQELQRIRAEAFQNLSTDGHSGQQVGQYIDEAPPAYAPA